MALANWQRRNAAGEARAPWTMHPLAAGPAATAATAMASLNAGLQEFDHGLVNCMPVRNAWCGCAHFRDEADDNWLVPHAAQGLAQVLDGATHLNQGLDTAKSHARIDRPTARVAG